MAQIIIACADEFGLVGEGYGPQDSEVHHLYEAYSDPRSSYFVLEMDGQVIGGGGITHLKGESHDWCEIQKMYLAPAARGKQFGAQLLEKLLDTAVNLGFTNSYLETTASLVGAFKLYKRFGFELSKTARGSTGHSSCEIFMVKDLSL